MRSGFIYIWRDNLKNRYYLGSHYGKIDDGYTGSGKLFLLAYNNRPNNFKRRIIRYFDNISHKDLLKEEEIWLKMIDDKELGNKYYNLKKVAAGGDIVSTLSAEKKQQHKDKSITARKRGLIDDRIKNPEKYKKIYSIAGTASAARNGADNLKTQEILSKRAETDSFMTPMGPRPFLTKAAKELGMCYQTLRKLVDKGESGYYWINKGNHFYS